MGSYSLRIVVTSESRGHIWQLKELLISNSKYSNKMRKWWNRGGIRRSLCIVVSSFRVGAGSYVHSLHESRTRPQLCWPHVFIFPLVSPQSWCGSSSWLHWTCGCCSLCSTTRDQAADPRKKTNWEKLDPSADWLIPACCGSVHRRLLV